MHVQRIQIIHPGFSNPASPSLRPARPSTLLLLLPIHPAPTLQVFRTINPKVVTRNELYGYLHPQTREWKEGLVRRPPCLPLPGNGACPEITAARCRRHQGWVLLV